MPGKDGTGPAGQGPRTGKIQGGCRPERNRKTDRVKESGFRQGREFRRGCGGNDNFGNLNRRGNKRQ